MKDGEIVFAQGKDAFGLAAYVASHLQTVEVFYREIFYIAVYLLIIVVLPSQSK